MEENKTKRYHRSDTGALILIILGAVFLLNNFGILSWGVWDTRWRFWPVLLVIWGLQLLFGAWWLGELITGIITLVILITVLLISVASTNTQLDNYMKDHFRWWPETHNMGKVGDIQKSSVTITNDDFPGIKKRLFRSDVGIGKFTLEDADTTNHLIMDSSYYSNFGSPELVSDKTTAGYDLAMKFKVTGRFNMWMGGLGNWGNLDYRATLGHVDLPTTVELKSGTGRVEVNLDKQKLDSLSLDLGTGSSLVTLTKESLPQTLSAHLGTGSLELHLPKGVGLKIKHNLGTGSIKVDGQSVKGDGTDKFYDYDNTETKVDLDLDLGTGSVSVITN